jgi:lysophospholipase L1-like esterase
MLTPVRYLALGDSYTIGTGATDASHNFPSLLASRLEGASGRPVTVQNPAVNGFTTRDLIRTELPQVQEAPHLVSVLIGANDVVQGYDAVAYRRALETIYDFVARFRLPAGSVLTLTVPDFSVVPTAGDFGTPAVLRARIDAFNRIAAETSAGHGFHFVDIGEVSRSGTGRSGWIAEDGLHPADAQYAAWADVIWKAVEVDWTRAVKPLGPVL